ncbi:unnamed protein product, partial [Didymodactylos carnosus]
MNFRRKYDEVLVEKHRFHLKNTGIDQIKNFIKQNYVNVGIAFDKNFNRKLVTLNKIISINYVVNKLNGYINIDTDKNDLLYDDRSNLINYDIRIYAYDIENKQIQMDNCSYNYDLYCNSISVTCIDGRNTTFIMDPFGYFGFDILTEIPSNGNISNYLNGRNAGLLVLQTNDIKFYFNFAGYFNSATALLNPSAGSWRGLGNAVVGGAITGTDIVLGGIIGTQFRTAAGLATIFTVGFVGVFAGNWHE